MNHSRAFSGRSSLHAAGRHLSAALAAGALLITTAGIAQADDIYNNLDNTIDSVAEVMPLNAGGATGSTVLNVNPSNGDGKNGCNLTGQTTLKLDIKSSSPAIASVSPSSVTFTSCDDPKTITVTPLTVGSTTVSATLVSSTAQGSFNLDPATFVVNVTAPAPSNTAPAVSITGVTTGASYNKGSVPAATCNVTDAEDGPSTFPATLSAITGPDSANGIGSQTASCSYTDHGGLVAMSSVTYSIVDSTPPTIDYTLTPATPDGNNGWYQSEVKLHWIVSEPDSTSTLSTTGCVDQDVTADQQSTDYSCSATSSGGSAGPVTVSLKKDGTAPSVGYTSASGTLGENGWYVSDVTATFTGTDATSGPASATQTATSSGEGSAVVVDSPAFTDNAGNSSAVGAAGQSFKIDKTAPTASFDSTLGDVYFGYVPAAPSCTSADDLSGPNGCVVTGYSTALGHHTLTATAKDMAGNTSVTTQDYTVLAWTLKGFYQPVDMNGVLNTVKGGSTVPAKFQVFAGPTELTDPSLLSFSASKITCSTTATQDAIETTATGNTSLRYDVTGGQFIYNWKTPTTTGSCYRLTVTAADGSSISANFKIK
ncbi:MULTISPECIES: PxKF domain-containing protein [Arthrobacter]|uniref:PxKF domain-containing protein n=2 Tax=Arthrobacter TaxID=1663 RepID=A0ABU9KIJ9_9MICC|nr:PxKF domain-containing protein [Arthrobacter sp. YJM1]MDP5226278.1 PxKF domain-containing protein [Arthrobacter sp. YJM1]